MQVYVQKSTMTTRPRRPSVASGGELSHSVAPSRDGILPSAMRRPGAQPGPRIAPLIVASRDRLVSMTRSSIPVTGAGSPAHPSLWLAQWPERLAQFGGQFLLRKPNLEEADRGAVGLGGTPRENGTSSGGRGGVQSGRCRHLRLLAARLRDGELAPRRRGWPIAL